MRSSGTKKIDLSAPLSITVSEGSHPENILAYRQEDFERMGFASYVAEYLASTRIDLHHMEDLLKKGCPLDVAPAILKGTAWYGNDPNDVYEESDDTESDDAVDADADE